jgi:hypothetical protein
MTTGTFYVNQQPACRGYYGTDTKIANTFTLNLPTNKLWTVTSAPNGTSLRLFSVTNEEWQLKRYTETVDKRTGNVKTFEHLPWAQVISGQLCVGQDITIPVPANLPTNRVWLLTTFKNIDGHMCHWGTTKTFGSMFEEILGTQGILSILMQTANDELCISYFMCHRDNDLYGQVEDSFITQTLIWNRRLQQFAGPNFPTFQDGSSAYWVAPPAPIRIPVVLSQNLIADQDSPVASEPHVVVNGPVQVMSPMLVTIFDGDSLVSYKLTTPEDEHVRQFRTRSHNKFAALFIAENMLDLRQESLNVTPEEHNDQSLEKRQAAVDEMLEELKVAKDRLFTVDELVMYKEFINQGRIEFLNQLEAKFTQWVVFDEAIYKHCDIQKNLLKATNVQEYQDLVWNKMKRCNKPFNVCCVEAFWRMCNLHNRK